MIDTVETLVRLLAKSERRAEEAERAVREVSLALAERPRAEADSDELARNLSGVAGGQKIMAIKLHRQFARTTLKDAKDMVERYWPERSVTQTGTPDENISPAGNAKTYSDYLTKST